MDHLVLLPQVPKQGAGSKVGWPGVELVPMWNAGVIGRSVTHYTTTLISYLSFSLSVTQIFKITK